MEVEQIRGIQNDNLQEIKQKYTMNKNCGVCYNNFIDIAFDDYRATIDKMRMRYGEYVAIRFELEMPIELCFSYRFVCLTCKDNNICFDCLTEITKHKTIIYPDCEKILLLYVYRFFLIRYRRTLYILAFALYYYYYYFDRSNY